MEYRIDRRILAYEAICTALAFSIGALMFIVCASNGNYIGVAFFALWAAVTGHSCFRLKDRITDVQIIDNDRISFRSISRKTEKDVNQLSEIRTNMSGGFIYFIFKDEKLGTFNRINGLSELIVKLKQINRDTKTIGI